jgi:hypothetical protein
MYNTYIMYSTHPPQEGTIPIYTPTYVYYPYIICTCIYIHIYLSTPKPITLPTLCTPLIGNISDYSTQPYIKPVFLNSSTVLYCALLCSTPYIYYIYYIYHRYLISGSDYGERKILVWNANMPTMADPKQFPHTIFWTPEGLIRKCYCIVHICVCICVFI